MELPTSPLTRENYFEFRRFEGRPVIHASALRHIYPGEGGSAKRLKLYFESEEKKATPSMSLGKIFHKYLENPKDFVVAPGVMPGEGTEKVVRRVYETYQEHHDTVRGLPAEEAIWTDDFKKLELIGTWVVAAAKEVGFQSNWKDDTIIRNVAKDGQALYDHLIAAEGHQILTAKQKEQVSGMQESLDDSQYAELIYSKTAMHEVPVLWKEERFGQEIWVKALLDWVQMPAANEKTIKVIDFKTTSKPLGIFFNGNRVEMHLGENSWYEMRKPSPGQFWEYRYYRQFYMYQLAAQQLYRQMNPTHNHIPEVIVKPMVFESEVPYECDLLGQPMTAPLIGKVEFNDAMAAVAGIYTLQKSY